MTARSRPEDIEYISRLKFGSQFSYTPANHAKDDIDVGNPIVRIDRTLGRWAQIIAPVDIPYIPTVQGNRRVVGSKRVACLLIVLDSQKNIDAGHLGTRVESACAAEK